MRKIKYIRLGHMRASRGSADKPGLNKSSSPPTTEPESLTMAGESRASFSATVINKLRAEHEDRCVICLTWSQTSQCAHVLDTASSGQVQVRSGTVLSWSRPSSDTCAP